MGSFSLCPRSSCWLGNCCPALLLHPYKAQARSPGQACCFSIPRGLFQLHSLSQKMKAWPIGFNKWEPKFSLPLLSPPSFLSFWRLPASRDYWSRILGGTWHTITFITRARADDQLPLTAQAPQTLPNKSKPLAPINSLIFTRFQSRSP